MPEPIVHYSRFVMENKRRRSGDLVWGHAARLLFVVSWLVLPFGVKINFIRFCLKHNCVMLTTQNTIIFKILDRLNKSV